MYLFVVIQGAPFPDQEFNAVDIVVRYAITELGFTFQDIIVFAWSIGMLLHYTRMTTELG